MTMFDLRHLEDMNRRLQELEAHSNQIVERGREYLERSKEAIGASRVVRDASEGMLCEGYRAARARARSMR